MSGDESKVELTISEEEFSRWLKPKPALEILRDSMSHSAALNAVVRYLMGGILRARADTVIAHYGSERKTYRRAPVPRDAWDDDKPSYSSPFWENGLFDWAEGFGHTERDFSAFDVRFDPAVIYKMAGREPPSVTALQTTPERSPTPPPPPALPPASPKKGGAPRKGWWDDLWIEVIRRIGAGKLTGDTVPSAARLEIELIEIAEGMGFSPGDSTLKPMSLKLFKYLKENGGK